MSEIELMQCPGCGARVAHNQLECEYCGGPVVIRSMQSIAHFNPLQINKYAASYKKQLVEAPDDKSLNMSLGMCYLKLKLYDKASEAFEKALTDNFEDSEPYFYAAVARLKGKKAFVAPRADIDKAIEYLNAANMIAPSPTQYLLLAYIKSDYFDRKYLRILPSAKEEAATALSLGISPADADDLTALLDVQLPSGLI